MLLMIIVFLGILLIFNCLFLFVILKLVLVSILLSIKDKVCFCMLVLLVLVWLRVSNWFISVFIWLVFCLIWDNVVGFIFCWWVRFSVICSCVRGEWSLWDILVNNCFCVFYIDLSCLVILLKLCVNWFNLFWCLVVLFICVC